ncbi:TPA: phage protein NinX family protein [Yersinia enterocolitica]|nr:DUF2591 family protein [Yersinia enterocolitica]EKN6106594.1 DUF2591 domain-containing protein [Yersinia enterocolitica]HEI6705633.1 DUF2591 family protein [Yersinia enterocolitica]
MKDYSAMSDFDINLAIAHLVLGKGNYDWNAEKKEVYRAGMDGGEFRPNAYFNPCEDPSDAWLIIFRERITLTPKVTGYEWDAISPVILNDDIEHLHTDLNPLRAAMIVFLMMKDRGNSHA